MDNNLSTPEPIRLAHFSDVHVTAPRCVWGPGDWRSKRMSAWINLRLLGRGKRFRYTEQIIAALRADIRRRNVDRIIFSGDASALGFEEEIARAASLLGVDDVQEVPGLAVPGNHDYCTHEDVRRGTFEERFAPWMQGERVGDAVYPFAQRAGSAWLIGVSSCTANRWAWDASGKVGPDQLDRLEKLLDTLAPGPRILVTHYPVYLPNGQREKPHHGLRNLDQVMKVAEQGGVSLWLHGHRHVSYRITRNVPFPVICAGSATQAGCWSYLEYTLQGDQLSCLRRVFSPADERFLDEETFAINLLEP